MGGKNTEKEKKEYGKMEEYTKYEVARILGARALQLSMNAPRLLRMEKNELEKIKYDPLKIAELEFKAGVLPITVRRPMPKKIEVEKKEEIEVEEEAKEEKGEEVAEEVAEGAAEEAEERETVVEEPETEEGKETESISEEEVE